MKRWSGNGRIYLQTVYLMRVISKREFPLLIHRSPVTQVLLISYFKFICIFAHFLSNSSIICWEGVIKSPNIIVDLSVSLLSCIIFWVTYFETLMVGACNFGIGNIFLVDCFIYPYVISLTVAGTFNCWEVYLSDINIAFIAFFD